MFRKYPIIVFTAGCATSVIIFFIYALLSSINKASTRTLMAKIVVSYLRYEHNAINTGYVDLEPFESIIKNDSPSIIFRERIPIDRWGGKIRMHIEDDNENLLILMTSSGPDMRMDTPDDIDYTCTVEKPTLSKAKD